MDLLRVVAPGGPSRNVGVRRRVCARPGGRAQRCPPRRAA